MSKLHGIKTMTAEVVKSKDGEVAETKAVKQLRVKKTKLHNRVGYGSFTRHVIMTNSNGNFVKVKRELVGKQLVKGWKTVKRSEYKAAVRKDESVRVVVEKKRK
jgi:hypothetical protein